MQVPPKQKANKFTYLMSNCQQLFGKKNYSEEKCYFERMQSMKGKMES